MEKNYRLKSLAWNDPRVAALLKECGLPSDDVSALTHFIALYTPQDELTGMIGMEQYQEYALLRSCAVCPNYRNRGIGKLLLEAFMNKCTDLGIQKVFLLTTTAEQYFSSHQFVKTDRSTVPPVLNTSSEFQFACPKSSVCMTRNI